jgi:hypothetical protein
MTRMRISGTAVLSILLLSACGPGEVIVTAEVDRMDPETGQFTERPLSNLRVQLVPFDRDFIFDSLAAQAATPEPQLPPELAAARDEIAEARQTWTEAESQWLSMRDRLQEISSEMAQYNPAEAQYRALFTEFNQLEGQYLQAEATKDEAFARFDQLQQETFTELEQHAAAVMAWEDEAFADWEIVVSERLRDMRREIVTDTTDATGRATLAGQPGEWWVYARFPEATDELYWNVPVTVDRAEPVDIRLTRGNAEVRPIF